MMVALTPTTKVRKKRRSKVGRLIHFKLSEKSLASLKEDVRQGREPISRLWARRLRNRGITLNMFRRWAKRLLADEGLRDGPLNRSFVCCLNCGYDGPVKYRPGKPQCRLCYDGRYVPVVCKVCKQVGGHGGHGMCKLCAMKAYKGTGPWPSQPDEDDEAAQGSAAVEEALLRSGRAEPS